MDFITLAKTDFTAALEHLRTDISSLRTGRATPSMIEDTMIEAYGTHQPLKTLATIRIGDAKTLLIEPWDKSVSLAIEVGIRNSGMGFGPVNDGTCIRLPLPELTADRRAELVKVLHQKMEEAKITFRKIREAVRAKIEQAEKSKTISEDEKFLANEALDKVVKEYNDEVKVMGEQKEQDIVTI